MKINQTEQHLLPKLLPAVSKEHGGMILLFGTQSVYLSTWCYCTQTRVCFGRTC